MAESSGLKKQTRFDGRLHIFARPNSPFVWCGFHHKGTYVRKSTKEVQWSAAIKVAENWYNLKQAEIITGVASFGGRSFLTAAKATLKTFEARVTRGERSPLYFKSFKFILSKVSPFFSSFSVDKIGIVEWEKYKTHCYEKNQNLARATLHQHKNVLRLVLNECYRNGWIKQIPIIKDVYNNEKIKVPRQWFDESDYAKLHRAIR
ncbi:MAG: phage integrase SAM-like domain-containing protein, partial [Hyphomicrobiales bacterium]|nr:phage integrase SAM-like domain-containing protein [Hyphomicrobiales bacterium]